MREWIIPNIPACKGWGTLIPYESGQPEKEGVFINSDGNVIGKTSGLSYFWRVDSWASNSVRDFCSPTVPPCKNPTTEVIFGASIFFKWLTFTRRGRGHIDIMYRQYSYSLYIGVLTQQESLWHVCTFLEGDPYELSFSTVTGRGTSQCIQYKDSMMLPNTLAEKQCFADWWTSCTSNLWEISKLVKFENRWFQVVTIVLNITQICGLLWQILVCYRHIKSEIATCNDV